jgi:mannosyltransferase PIG-V
MGKAKRFVYERLQSPPVASRALVVFLVATGTIFGYRTGGFPPIPDVNLPVIYGLARWDSGYYMGMATGGFGSFPEDKGYAFRPLFPIILRMTYPLFGLLDVRSAEVLAGFIWNTVALVVATVYLERLTTLLLGPQVASRTLLLLAVYPSSFFFSAIYPEATCILLIASSLYYLESGLVLRAGVLGFLAGLVRPETFLLSIPFLVKALMESRKLIQILAGTMVLLSVPLFALFSYFETGNLFVALDVERAWPKCAILCFLSNPVYHFATSDLAYSINFIAMTLAIALIIYPLLSRSASARTFPYYLWAFILLGTFFYVGEILSWARLMLVIPPIFWAQAEYSLNHPRFFQGLVVTYALMMSLATVLFVNWYPML